MRSKHKKRGGSVAGINPSALAGVAAQPIASTVAPIASQIMPKWVSNSTTSFYRYLFPNELSRVISSNPSSESAFSAIKPYQTKKLNEWISSMASGPVPRMEKYMDSIFRDLSDMSTPLTLEDVNSPDFTVENIFTYYVGASGKDVMSLGVGEGPFTNMIQAGHVGVGVLTKKGLHFLNFGVDVKSGKGVVRGGKPGYDPYKSGKYSANAVAQRGLEGSHSWENQISFKLLNVDTNKVAKNIKVMYNKSSYTPHEYKNGAKEGKIEKITLENLTDKSGHTVKYELFSNNCASFVNRLVSDSPDPWSRDALTFYHLFFPDIPSIEYGNETALSLALSSIPALAYFTTVGIVILTITYKGIENAYQYIASKFHEVGVDDGFKIVSQTRGGSFKKKINRFKNKRSKKIRK